MAHPMGHPMAHPMGHAMGHSMGHPLGLGHPQSGLPQPIGPGPALEDMPR